MSRRTKCIAIVQTGLVAIAGLASLATPAPRTTWRIDQAAPGPVESDRAFLLEVSWTGSGNLGSDDLRGRSVPLAPGGGLREPPGVLCKGQQTATLLTALGGSPNVFLAGSCPISTGGCFASNCTVPRDTSLRILRAAPVRRWLRHTEIPALEFRPDIVESFVLEVDSVTSPTLELPRESGAQPLYFVTDPTVNHLAAAHAVLTSACTTPDESCRYDRARRYTCTIHMRWLGAQDGGPATARIRLIDRAPCEGETPCVPPTPDTPKVVGLSRLRPTQ